MCKPILLRKAWRSSRFSGIIAPMQLIGRTKNNREVYIDPQSVNATAHLTDTPELLKMVQGIVGSVVAEGDELAFATDMGREIGDSDLVKTSPNDAIVYAKRLNRPGYTRFVLDRKPEPTRFVTVILRLNPNGSYRLHSAWIGPLVPSFPDTDKASAESKPFWQQHALVWGRQAIQPGTEMSHWPWG